MSELDDIKDLPRYVPDRLTYLRNVYTLRGYAYWLREDSPLMVLARAWAAYGKYGEAEHDLAEMFLVLHTEITAPDDGEKSQLQALVGELHQELKNRVGSDLYFNPALSNLDSRVRAALGE